MVRVHYKPSRVLEVAPVWQLQTGALLRTPKLARDSAKVSNPMFRVSVFHGRVMHKFALCALISEDDEGTPYAKIEQMQMPASGDDYSVALNGVSVYSRDGLWDAMNAWFDGGTAVPTEAMQNGSQSVSFTNNGGAIVGEISGGGEEYSIDLDYLDNTMMTFDAMGFEHGLDATTLQGDVFLLPEYFELGRNDLDSPLLDELHEFQNI